MRWKRISLKPSLEEVAESSAVWEADSCTDEE